MYILTKQYTPVRCETTTLLHSAKISTRRRRLSRASRSLHRGVVNQFAAESPTASAATDDKTKKKSDTSIAFALAARVNSQFRPLSDVPRIHQN